MGLIELILPNAQVETRRDTCPASIAMETGERMRKGLSVANNSEAFVLFYSTIAFRN